MKTKTRGNQEDRKIPKGREHVVRREILNLEIPRRRKKGEKFISRKKINTNDHRGTQ